MSHGGDLENFVLRTIERWYASRYSERHGLVTSYDPKKYLAKVTFQPEGHESGWLPIETGHVGQGYGIAIGLQPGSGKGESQSNSEATGDQVIIRFQEGDFEGGKIVQRVHSDQDKPPEVKSGEMVFWTKFKNDSNPGPDAAADGQSGSNGQRIYFKNDGSLLIEDGNGATYTFDGKGGIKLTGKSLEWDISGDIKINGKTVSIVGSDAVTVKSTGAALDLNGKPIKANGGGATIPAWTLPG